MTKRIWSFALPCPGERNGVLYSVFKRSDTGSRQENRAKIRARSGRNAFVSRQRPRNAAKTKKRLRRIDASVFRAVRDGAITAAASLPDFCAARVAIHDTAGNQRSDRCDA
jgi:hypothetical protein